MKKYFIIILSVLLTILIGACHRNSSVDKAFYFGDLEDVDYMYIIPSEEGENWNNKIEISNNQLEEHKGIKISFSDFQESENEIYNIRFHTKHYYFIDFFEVKLLNEDSMFLWPIDDDHSHQTLAIKRISQYEEETYEASSIVYEFIN